MKTCSLIGLKLNLYSSFVVILVMRDIVGQMLDSRCVNEIFRPQKVLTRKSLRMVFERLAHASIMKLNSSAMDKVLPYNCIPYCKNI